MTTLLIATRNAHKVAEIRALLSGQCACLSQNDLPEAPTIVEDEINFAGNARKKAEGLAAWIGDHSPLANCAPEFILADDSGLEVDALGGAPGVHSARFAAEEISGSANAPDAANNAKLLRLLAGVPLERRGARFRCALALAPLRAAAKAGSTDGWNQSLAELGESVKNTMSHRARALRQLREFLLQRG